MNPEQTATDSSVAEPSIGDPRLGGRSLPQSDWLDRMVAHEARVRRWIDPHRERRSRQERHPVYDFLFEYYSFRPGQLLRWSPGPGAELIGKVAKEQFGGRKGYVETRDGVLLCPVVPKARQDYLRWAIEYLRQTGDRAPHLSCFGLHEWAMVYRASEARHSRYPLRLPADDLARFVESQDLCCTHYDAFRFFTPAARSLNRTILSREVTSGFDQPGCVHVAMDLYKFRYKIHPWIESELIADAFELALAAREIDMRASPYALSSLGFTPIRVETADGRAQYVRLQRALYERTGPLRQRLVDGYTRLSR
jgi:hypothetical protein